MYELIVRMPFGTDIIHDVYETYEEAQLFRCALICIFEPEQVTIKEVRDEED